MTPEHEARDDKGLSVYWDYGTTLLNPKALFGYEVLRKIRSALHTFGPIQSFKMYHDSSNQSLSSLSSELASSGVTVIDCPNNGRREAATKTMIVDIIAYAWDHPAPRTIIIITGDRDLGYLIATLRMRKFPVVLMSPRGTHGSLTNQASVNLDWTTGIANIEGHRTDMDNTSGGQPSPPPSSHAPPSPHHPPSLHLLPSPSFPPPPLPATNGFFSHYPKAGFLSKAQVEIDPHKVELRGIPTTGTRGRQGSIFPHSYEPDKFNVFGDLGVSFGLPISNGMFGLGDEPLFPRSHSRVPARQVRSDSAPPGLYSTHPLSSLPDNNSFGEMASSRKGKQREFPITEPEDIALQSPPSAKMPEVNTLLTRGTSNRSSVTSPDNVSSVIQLLPSSAPTSAEPVYINNDDTTERGKDPATIIVIAPQELTSAPPRSPAVRDTEKVSGPNPSPEKEETDKAILIKDSSQGDVGLHIQPQVPNPFRPSPAPPSSSKKTPPKKTTTNAPAGLFSPPSMYVPPQFQVLVETLRQHNGSYLRGSLPTLLLARDPDVYKKAQKSKYTKYIEAAVEAGLVREVDTTKGIHISLTTQYA